MSGLLSPVVELRRYTLRPGARDVLIDLFDSTLVESQEREGMAVIGQFREVDEPHAFTWLRGFPNMVERARSLERFYSGPVWLENRVAANATMLDSTNVLLLRPARPDSAFALDGERAAPGSQTAPPGIVEATVLYLERSVDEGVILSFFELAIADVVEAEGGRVLGYFLTEDSENTSPASPCARTSASSASSVGTPAAAETTAVASARRTPGGPWRRLRDSVRPR